MHIPTLQTDRLILRALTIADAPAIFEWVSDPIVTKFMSYNTYTNVEDVVTWLRSVQTETKIYNFGFVRKGDGKLIGAGSIEPKNNAWEFGYNLRHDCWNQGYVTEAAREMVRFARDEKGATAFTAAHAIDNPASGRVIEKCGLRFDHCGSYSSFDGQRTFASKFYCCTADETRARGNIAVKAPTIETDRLILRALTAADAPAVFKWVSDPIVTKYMPYNTYTRVEDVEAWLRDVEAETFNYNFAFVRKSDGAVIGSGDIGPNDDRSAWEFGYNIRHDCWNNGYATEAARAMIAFARDTMGVTCFAANHATDNPASGRVMQKCGLHYDHAGSYSSFDGLRIFPASFYTGTAASTRIAAAPAPVCESERLLLRRFAKSDAPCVFHWASDPQVTHFLSWNPHESIEVTKQWLAFVQDNCNPQVFAIVRKQDGLPIGCIDLRLHDSTPAEFGYLLRRDVWGQGYATEALNLLFQYAHNTHGCTTFSGVCAKANPASAHVMQKCGLKYERDDQYTKLDSSITFDSQRFTGNPFC